VRRILSTLAVDSRWQATDVARLSEEEVLQADMPVIGNAAYFPCLSDFNPNHILLRQMDIDPQVSTTPSVEKPDWNFNI
jgi:hypothetical protein